MQTGLARYERQAAAIARELRLLRQDAEAAAVSRRSVVEMAADLGIALDPWQRQVIESTAPQMLLNCSRQSGKSTTAALLGLHTALAVDDALVLIVSPGERQSKLLFQKLLLMYRRLGKPTNPLTENKLSLELANGSQVHALPGEEGTVRGFSGVSLLLIDEASRVDDDMMAAVRPMLAVSGGRLVAMSTPFGKRGWWYEAFVNGGDDWQRFEVPATQCPRISPAFLESERRSLPRIWYESEYLCQFLENEDSAFSHESIARAFENDIQPLFPVGSEAA